MSGAREGSLHRLRVAVVIIERDILRHVLIQKRRAAARGLLGGHDGRERFNVECDRFGCILRLRERLGDDKGDRIAHITYPIGRKRISPRLFQG